MRAYSYSLFGLALSSQIPLPELGAPQKSHVDTPDVTIRVGKVKPTIDGGEMAAPGVFARAGLMLLDYEPARFLVAGGNDVTVRPRSRARRSDVRIYLLGSVMGAVLYQRGIVPLHANAIVTRSGAVAFAGPSGAGKSTLAAAFQDRGFQVLCDDVCAVTFDRRGLPLAWPGVPRIKLWSDALSAMGRRPEGLERVWAGEEKYSLPLSAGATPSDAHPLTKIFVLKSVSDAGAAKKIERLSGGEAFKAVIENLYRGEFAKPLGCADLVFKNAVAVAAACQVFSLAIPRLPDGPGEVEKAIEEVLR
jgi:hypothetical protein